MHRDQVTHLVWFSSVLLSQKGRMFSPDLKKFRCYEEQSVLTNRKRTVKKDMQDKTVLFLTETLSSLTYACLAYRYESCMKKLFVHILLARIFHKKSKLPSYYMKNHSF